MTLAGVLPTQGDLRRSANKVPPVIEEQHELYHLYRRIGGHRVIHPGIPGASLNRNHGRLHVGRCDYVLIAALRFCPIQRGIGVLDEGIGS